jgi:flagellar assembly factor FliW
MRIDSDRFGAMDLDPRDTITFENGLIGFARETAFVLLRHKDTSPIGWLQSVKTPSFALPVVSIEALDAEFDVGLLGADFDPEGVALMAVLNASGPMPSVNLVAPIVVNVEAREGKQVIVTGSELTSQTPFVLRKPEIDAPAAEAPAALAEPAPVAAPAVSGVPGAPDEGVAAPTAVAA